MSTITLSSVNSAAVRTLAQVLWNALDSRTIRTVPPAPGWPFSPDSLDFSSLGGCSIAVDGITGNVTLSFASGSPVIAGVLDLALLEAQLSSSPNYLDYESPSDQGPASSVSLTSPSFTRQKSGVVFLTAEFDGTQSSQQVVTVSLYRDYGLAGQVNLAIWHVSPGGIGAFNWSGHIHDVDILPDLLPHTYTFIAAGSGGSNLSLSAGSGELIMFELGGPG
jgi:hypothetical protein